jgi:hypothetical protein
VFTGGNLFIPEAAREPGNRKQTWPRSIFTISDAEGRIDRIVTLTEDITERK